jgi:PAS domain S-box-containing protein
LIEDNPGDTRLIQEMINEEKGANNSIECFSRLALGLKRLAQGGIDVILLDLGLPDSQGVNTFEKTYAVAPKVPILILTANDNDAIAIEAVSKGAQDFLIKGNTDGSHLFRAINYAIERKKTEEKQRVRRERLTKVELEKREAKLAAIIESSQDAIAIINLDGNIIECNQATVDLYCAQSKKKLIGKNVFAFIAKIDHEETLQILKTTINKGSIKPVEYTFLSLNGVEFNGEFSAKIVMDTSGKPDYLVTITRDITEKKRLEEKARNSEKFAILGQVTSSVAHEIRNPIGVIKNSVYYLNLKLKDTSNEKIAKHLKIMERNINSADRIISDLLEIGRNKSSHLESTGLDTILESTFARLIIPKDIEVIKKLDKIPKVQVDPEHIERLFLNIIQNAFAAMPQGGKLTIQLSISGNYIEISFQDSGEGIPKENLQKLFTPLFTTKTKGLGLGLIICRQIVEAHKGEIKISSNVGEGTLVVIRLPLLEKLPIDPALQLGEISK